jgi:hypothetical protein
MKWQGRGYKSSAICTLGRRKNPLHRDCLVKKL